MATVRRNAVFTFETSRQILAAQQVLRRAGIGFEEVPPPREVAAGCGVALRIALSDLSAVVDLFAFKDAEWEAVYELGAQQEVVAKLG
ncbi:MAG: DUF3343 domain-containing protein [Thermoleophilia bacterium]|nr:DUF3343 domain-containing protein [Thermoleophilia bacterium]